MPPRPDQPEPVTTVSFTIEGEDFHLQSQVTVPVGPTPLSALLPLARGLADVVVRETLQAVAATGDKLSCRAGCGACCRTLVAISEVEARRLLQVIEELPEPRRSGTRERFADARRRLEAAGLLEALQQPEKWDAEGYSALVVEYFRQGIPCPFLEAEACSIYAERPITCREHLVVSAPEHCARPDSAEVRRVRLPLQVFSALARVQSPDEGNFEERVVPLILAPEWAEANPEEPPSLGGQELLGEMLHHLSVKRSTQADGRSA